MSFGNEKAGAFRMKLDVQIYKNQRHFPSFLRDKIVHKIMHEVTLEIEKGIYYSKRCVCKRDKTYFFSSSLT